MEQGFEKASSNNLPKITMDMIASLMQNNQNYNSAVSRGKKEDKSARPSYGDRAIGYVQIKRKNPKCYVKAQVTPEHKVRKKGYPVEVEIDEDHEDIISAKCTGCVAGSGGCKHAIALVFRLHRRSEELSVTEVLCYWKKSALSKVGTTKKFITLSEMVPGSSMEVSDLNVEDLLRPHFNDVEDSAIINKLKPPSSITNLSVHYLYANFLETDQLKKCEIFLKYCTFNMADSACIEAERTTITQSDSKMWFELRYGRISASNIFDSTRCKVEGSLVEKIFGANKTFDTYAMKRGRRLEDPILKVLCKETGIKFKKCGVFLNSNFPVLGASPDAISNEYVVEIKAATKEKTFENYYKNNTIQKKYLSQIQIQMHFTKKMKGYFVIADPDFENNNKITKIIVGYNQKFCETLIKEAMLFWTNFIFKNMYT